MKFVKSPAVPGFFLASMLLRGLQCASFSPPVFLRGAVPRYAPMRAQCAGALSRAVLLPLIDRARFSNTNHACGNAPDAIEGYPPSTRKKKCAYLVTYRHSKEQHFEKPTAARAMIKEM
jgi:hypothetical protein